MASTSDAALPSDPDASLIEQFCSVTGSNEEKAKKMLEICNWNLEMAVNMHVDTDFQENGAMEAINGIELDGVRAPIPQSRAILVDEDPSFHYGLRGRKRRPHSVFDGFRDFQAEAELQEQTSGEDSENLKKMRTLEDLFRPPLDIMHRGNFDSARDRGQNSHKWLMVNLQDQQEFSCQVLNRDVWSNKLVKELVMEHFIFWQVYSDSMDGQRFMNFYKPAKFPYIAVLDPRTGEKIAEWHDVIATTICDRIYGFLDEFNGSLEGTTKAVFPKTSKFSLLDKSEEEQLKAALAASVRETTLVNVEDNDSDIETFDSDTESPSVFTKASIVKDSSDHSNDAIDVVSVSESSVTDIPKTWKDYLGLDSDPKSDLVLRLPDGKREQISWPCTTKVKSLLLYIREIGFDPEEYELVTNFPRRNLCQLDVFKSLKEVDLFPREMIFVQLKT